MVEVLQTLQSSKAKATALPVKRRRAAQEEDGGSSERDKYWISNVHLSAGVRLCESSDLASLSTPFEDNESDEERDASAH